MKKKVIFIPFLFTFYGVLSLLANNITQVDLFALRTLLYSTIACCFILIFFRIIIKDVQQASLISSGAIIIIFLHGHVKTYLQSVDLPSGINFFSLLTIISWVLFFVYIYFVLKVLKNYDHFSKYLFTVGVILLVFPIYTLVTYYYQTSKLELDIQDFRTTTFESYGVSSLNEDIIRHEPLPDIYYIILDAYSRSDILSEIYGYDNSPFEESLMELGFYVASESNSNYKGTISSLSSSLNMVPLGAISEYVVKGNVNPNWVISSTLMDMLHNNRVMEIFKSLGYSLVSYESGFDAVKFSDIDHYMVSPVIEDSNYKAKNMFELFIVNTFLDDLYLKLNPRESPRLSSIYDAHRERLIFTFESIPNFAGMEGSYFVFAHILAPHPPFVFGPNGEAISGMGAFTLADTKPNRDIQLYLDELHYINFLVLELIDKIIEKSDVPPIIIIQGDHGSRIFLSENRTSEMQNDLYFPILNAYYLPGEDVNALLYPSISPINSFRLILNKYFGTHLALLPDESYLWGDETDQEFIQVSPK